MSTSNKCLFIPLCIIILLPIFIVPNIALDTITVNQNITDGDTIISSGGRFEMGFFSPGSSKNRYVGIWYKDVSIYTPLWVANREAPLVGSSGTLKITKHGVLVLLDNINQIVWSSNVSSSVPNPVAQLLDTGNLVVKNAGDENSENFHWQSFDFPGNTLLDGMKMGRNFVTGQEWQLTSWKSEEDPSPGDYTYKIDTHGYPQITQLKGGNVLFRVGPWIGDRFSGQQRLKEKNVFQDKFLFTKMEVNYSFVVLNISSLTRLVLSPSGVMQWSTWAERQTNWIIYSSGPPTDACDNYASCGAYGSCFVDNSLLCLCLNKFVGKASREYNAHDWSSGCVRRIYLDCGTGDNFLKYSGLKLPDTRKSWFNTSMSLEECRVMCSLNCNCTAYSNMKFNGEGSGCFLWFEELMDLKSSVYGEDIYIRMASSESDKVSPIGSPVGFGGNKSNSPVGSHGNKDIVGVLIAVPIAVLMLLLCLSRALLLWKKKLQNLATTGNLDLPLFDLAKIINATDNFSLNNKLGEGGYGTVYKASLEGGEVAVKRLSKDSRQGFDEFMNEATFIAKLQHRNLVKLLGCCIEAEEKILIYEYMPNKSLDYFIFDEARSSMLDWPTRFHIINGISRGIVYLHQDSRLRIIHRDLKASNILLDIDMNPKIADFGMARSFGGNETAGNTMRVVGTYGYMSPEYQLHGLFSMKSDVFSFGVLVLEIVCGRRNRGFHHPEHHFNLLGHAWTLYNGGRSLELVDTHTIESGHLYETLRCIHVALLCVQQIPEDRPTMSDIVLMLRGNGELLQPKQPGFFTGGSPLENVGTPICSINEITISNLDPR